MTIEVNRWRGLVRGNLKVGRRVANSFLNYHNKHDLGVPEADKFLSAAEVATVTAFLDFCEAALEETKAR